MTEPIISSIISAIVAFLGSASLLHWRVKELEKRQENKLDVHAHDEAWAEIKRRMTNLEEDRKVDHDMLVEIRAQLKTLIDRRRLNDAD